MRIISFLLIVSFFLLPSDNWGKQESGSNISAQTKSHSEQNNPIEADKTNNINQSKNFLESYETGSWILFLLIPAGVIILYIRYREKRKLIEKITNQNLELEKLNAELRVTNQKYTELVSTRDRFFSIIAHDLKSPFNSILGFADIIVEEAGILKKEDLEEYAGSIRNSAKSTLILLQNLLDWSRTQTGKLQIEKSYFRLLEVIEENLRLHKLAAEKKGIELINNIKPDAVVYADSSMISAIVRNLINNAIKFTAEGKVIIDCEKKNGLIEVTITDTGTGISEEGMGKLFKIETFHSTQGTRHEHGTGLGLILCKEFVERNGGTIKAESVAGKGSKFTFTIDTKRQEQNTLAAGNAS